MARLASAVFLAAWLVAGAPVRAQHGSETGGVADDEEKAQALFHSGSEAFEQGRYEEALEHFQSAYELTGRPQLLFHIGDAAERLRRDRLALEMFERYIAADPAASDRAAVEARIQVLRAALADRAAATGSAPSPAAVPPEDDPGGPGAAPWILLGSGAAVAVGGAILLGVAGASGSDVESAEEGTPWPEVQDDYDRAGTLSVLGGIALGVGAAAALSAAAWLVLGAGGGEGRVEVAVGPGGLVLRGAL